MNRFILTDIVELLKRIFLFLTAFAPLGIILIIKYSNYIQNYWYMLLSIIPSALIIILILFLKKKSETTLEKQYVKIIKKNEITQDVVFYILGYMPVLLINNFNGQEIITFISMSIIISIIYIKKNMSHINPIIVLFYRTYKVKDQYGNNIVLISNMPIPINEHIAYQEIATNVNVVIDDRIVK